MKRALELAARGLGYTSPNPMVGAVIVHDGRIIGEGYHRQHGKVHAEVNAVNSVAPADRPLLTDSTMYVTLEPCSHYGKTPPCARLIIETGIPRVVVGAVDPFAKVAGRGIAMLREAGVEVTEGILADESRRLNATFFTAHTLGSPFVTLKWAQSADMFMDRERTPDDPTPARFSNTASTMLTHRLRSLHDAILTTAATVNADNPRLNVRRWGGRDPQPVIIDRRAALSPDAAILGRSPIIIDRDMPLDEMLAGLYSRHGITSLLVEAGPTLLQQFIDADQWDLVRIETAPVELGEAGTRPAPRFSATPGLTRLVDGNRLDYYTANPLVTL